MASLQIQDLRQKFNNLTILEECGWEKASNTSKDVFQEKVVSGIASEPKHDDAGIADGGRLAAVKKAMRERMQPGERAEAVGSAVPKEVDHKAFDTGSFRIESPVKSFSDPENRTQAPTRERGAAQRQHAGHPPWPPCPCPPWWLSRAETGRRSAQSWR
ncbi:disks large-associated protein 5-like [Equus asinus]|uniref:disks large-associated protein 5-like n=1 Tax=Equus asinus TaxID=9793 RepID=UPI0038F6B93C